MPNSNDKAWVRSCAANGKLMIKLIYILIYFRLYYGTNMHHAQCILYETYTLNINYIVFLPTEVSVICDGTHPW